MGTAYVMCFWDCACTSKVLSQQCLTILPYRQLYTLIIPVWESDSVVSDPSSLTQLCLWQRWPVYDVFGFMSEILGRAGLVPFHRPPNLSSLSKCMSDWMRECGRNKTSPSPPLEIRPEWIDSVIIVCEESDRPILVAPGPENQRFVLAGWS